MTPLGLLIGPLNTFAANQQQTPVDAAENILERLRQGGFLIICAGCGREWTDFCKCSREEK